MGLLTLPSELLHGAALLQHSMGGSKALPKQPLVAPCISSAVPWDGKHPLAAGAVHC